ncbi:MAG: 4Fe-4S single cluster domain [Anaerosporomusa subterranea]|jgi:hypothetical protein|nr:4Fe-4S single cluster domain [Anaerosporomusa subterranea]
MKKARLLVTLECPRSCEGCCNDNLKLDKIAILPSIDQLLQYDEVIISGGEPMLIPGKVMEFCQTLRQMEYTGQIYMYSALYNHTLREEYVGLLRRTGVGIKPLLNGLHFTVHNEAGDREINELKQLSKFLQIFSDKQLRLAIDGRLYERFDFSNIEFSAWDVVRKLQWKDDCPLPSGEELFIYNL